MAITDALTTFGLATALNTGAAGNYIVGNAVPLVTARDIGAGQPIYLVITVETACTSGGSATAAFTLLSAAADPAVTSDNPVLITPAFAVADMVAGAILYSGPIPAEGVAYQGFLGLMQTTGVAAFTAGAINATLQLDAPTWQSYPDGVNAP